MKLELTFDQVIKLRVSLESLIERDLVRIEKISSPTTKAMVSESINETLELLKLLK